jgi:hypothetical protein
MFYRLDNVVMNILKENVFEPMIFDKDAIFQDMFDKGIGQQHLFFLKNTQLCQIEIKDNPKDKDTFFIINKAKKTSIAVSNRISTKNELRGQILKDRLTAEENSPQFIYDLLTQNNPNIFTINLIKYFNNGLKESYPLDFLQLVEYLIYEKVKNKTDKATFWVDVNFDNIFSRANLLYKFPFLETLEQLQFEKDLLKREGYLDASNALQEIHDGLIAEFVNLEQDSKQFSKNCSSILDLNNHPELKVHHHLFKKVLSVLAQLFNFLSFGLIPQYKTESERMVISLFNSLNSISLEPETQSHLVSPV